MFIYALYDLKAAEYGQPVVSQSDGTVARVLSGLPQGSIPREHPEDFNLVEIGEMDMSTGRVTPTGPRVVCSLTVILNGGAR